MKSDPVFKFITIIIVIVILEKTVKNFNRNNQYNIRSQLKQRPS